MKVAGTNRLALVIPAFKPFFFDETLKSIASQTCKDFVLYIGDDASPYSLADISKRYQDKITIVYKKFDYNMGSRSLTMHWNRCLEMLENEEWIWFFSDDDLMDINCVQLFFEFIKFHPNEDLLHFDVDVINEKGDRIKRPSNFPNALSAADFFSKKIKWEIESFVVEYIFRREPFELAGKFEPFDLGWCSDDATWIKLSRFKNINTITGARVKWRHSEFNISSSNSSSEIVIRKLLANSEFIKWAIDFFKKGGLSDQTSRLQKARWIFIEVFRTSALSFFEKCQIIREYSGKIGYPEFSGKFVFYIIYFSLRKRILSLLRGFPNL
jgi:glycosyltransferase involved in cell wall biosynthesis